MARWGKNLRKTVQIRVKRRKTEENGKYSLCLDWGKRYNFGTSKDFFIVKYDDLAYAFSRSIGGAGDDIVNAMKLVNLYLFIIVFVVLVVASLFYSKSFSSPISKLNSATKDISILNFNTEYLLAKSNK